MAHDISAIVWHNNQYSFHSGVAEDLPLFMDEVRTYVNGLDGRAHATVVMKVESKVRVLEVHNDGCLFKRQERTYEVDLSL